MKISAAPFESPLVSAPASAENVDAPSAEDVVAAVGGSGEVKAELDSSTRQSLSRLAGLIRSQMKSSDVAHEAKQEEARREEEQSNAREQRNERALKVINSTGEDESVSRERINKASYPTVERVEEKYQEERRKRGVQIYTKQKTRESVEQILAALEGVQPPADLVLGGSFLDDEEDAA